MIISKRWLIATLIAAATLLVFVAVIHRYAAGMPIPGLQDWLLSINLSWAQELCIYMFIWMAKFGAAYGVRTGIHVGVDVLINRLPDNLRRKYVLFGLLSGALFTIIVGHAGRQLRVVRSATPPRCRRTWSCRCGSSTCAFRLGSYLMCFRFLQVAWAFFRTGELPHHDHGFVEGLEDVSPLDINPLGMRDNLHPADVKTGGRS